jgi:exodeoxyribonuclease-3
MKIISWNVNWLRAVVKKWFLDFIQSEKPDIVCLQEVKSFETQIPPEVNFILNDYNYIRHSWQRPWYAWTAIFYSKKLKIINSKNSFEDIEFHEDGRLTELAFQDINNKEVVLINWYFPNGWTRADGTEMLTYKLWFYDKIIKYIDDLKKKWKNIIICWDLNICHQEIDIARPKENQKSIWFLPIERNKITEVLNWWYIDIFRHFFPIQKDTYSWWSYRAWARVRNVGWRLDYFVTNNDYLSNIIDIKYLTHVLWSDHCPVSLFLK